MLLRSQCHFEALVVRDLIVIVTAHDRVHHIDVASEHLVKMSTLTMGLGATYDCRCEGTM
jgi:hypothetical protein